jgi:two-component system, NtrC family, response regulator HydG
MAGRKRILIVEDNEEYNNDLRKLLEEYEIEILSAFSGKQALEIMKSSGEGYIDLILSDVKMPDGDGVFLLRELSKLNYKIPIFVFLTGYADFLEEDIIKLGVTALFNKPLEVNKLLMLM